MLKVAGGKKINFDRSNNNNSNSGITAFSAYPALQRKKMLQF